MYDLYELSHNRYTYMEARRTHLVMVVREETDLIQVDNNIVAAIFVYSSL